MVDTNVLHPSLIPSFRNLSLNPSVPELIKQKQQRKLQVQQIQREEEERLRQSSTSLNAS